MSTINANEHNNTMNTNNKEEVTMTVEEAKKVVKESLGKRMTIAEADKLDALRKFIAENEKQDVASINANSTVATPVTKAPTKAAKPAAASKDTKAYRTNMDAGVTKMTNEELSLKSLYEKFPVVLAQGTVINLLQEAIDNGALMELIKASADAHHSGDVLAQVKVLRTNLSSKKQTLRRALALMEAWRLKKSGLKRWISSLTVSTKSLAERRLLISSVGYLITARLSMTSMMRISRPLLSATTLLC